MKFVISKFMSREYLFLTNMVLKKFNIFSICTFIIHFHILLICHQCHGENDLKNWWKNTIIYELLLQSFKDSNGDGIGDINGVALKLDHFTDLKIDTIWLSPFCQSPMFDSGYDVSNYIDIDPTFGKMDHFDNLVKELDKRNMKIIMDLVINHSSDEHPWFKKSINKIHPYTDYYVWKDPKGYDEKGNPIQPTHWKSIFGGSAWTWIKERRQFYLHNFAICQPDLNLTNPYVVDEVQNIIDFWIGKGIDGFRLDAPSWYIEHPQFPDADYPEFFEYTVNQPETFDFVYRLRRYLDTKYNNRKDTQQIIFIAESMMPRNVSLRFYGNESFPQTHYPLNSDLILYKDFPTSEFLDKYISDWLYLPLPGSVVNWASECHDFPRIASNLNEQFMDIYVILTMVLPGVVTIYYGQEIGTTASKVREDLFQLSVHPHRNELRLPMQWDDSPQAGFSTNKETWLPVNPNYWAVNVEAQKKKPDSRYNLFKTLALLRKNDTIKYGQFNSYTPSKWIYIFTRTLPNRETYVTIINLGTIYETIELPSVIPHNQLPAIIQVVASSLNSIYKIGDRIRIKPKFKYNIHMRPSSCIVAAYKKE